MPLYEYKCEHCGKEFEVIKSSADKTPEPCPVCGKEAEKLLSVFARGGGGGGRVCAPGSGGSFGGG